MNKTYAVLAHLSGLLLAFLGPLIFFLIADDELSKNHAREALNFQISLILYSVVSGLLCLVLVGFFLLSALGLLCLICSIIGAVKASKGEEYHYPLTIRFVK